MYTTGQTPARCIANSRIISVRDDGRTQGATPPPTQKNDGRTQGATPPPTQKNDGRPQGAAPPPTQKNDGRPQGAAPPPTQKNDGRPQGAAPPYHTTPVPTMYASSPRCRHSRDGGRVRRWGGPLRASVSYQHLTYLTCTCMEEV